MIVLREFWRLWLTGRPRRGGSGGGGGPIENAPPVANPDTATVVSNTPTLIDVLANDSDPEGGALTLVSATTTTGTAVVQAGQVLYTSPAGFSGGATISYVIADPQGATATGTVAVTVTAPPNAPPVANPDTATVVSNTPTLIDVLANDSDPEGGALTLVSATTTTGTAVVEAGQVLYTSPAGFSGGATISYVIADPQGATATGTVAVTVTAPPNAPPVANPDTATVFSNTPTLIDVLANDSDPEGGALTLVSATTTTGTAVVEAGQVLYTSPAGFSGGATISYVIADPQGATATGTVAVTVLVPSVTATPNADGTLTVQAETGVIEITVTAPPAFAGTYTTDTGLLATGPVNLVPPAVAGTSEVGQTLTAISGLWLHTGTVPGTAWQWLRNGSAILGETLETYVLAAADAGQEINVGETLSDPAGSRTAASAPLAIPSAFVPSDDASIIAWFDADAPTTVTASGGLVSAWASRVGSVTLSQLDGLSRPTVGLRSIGGRNVLDFDGSDRLTGSLSVPSNGNVAIHAVIAVDSVTSAFAAALAMRGTSRDFQLDANNATQFDGRLNVTGIGDTVALGGGPFNGTRLISIVFDRTGAGTVTVYVDGVLRATAAYATPLDIVQALHLMANRNQNAFVNGAVAEVIVTGGLANRLSHQAYLAGKWGIL